MRAPARHLWALVKNLPDESATWREYRFTRSEDLIALVAQLVDMGNRGEAFKKPIEIRRPGQKAKVTKIADFVKRHAGSVGRESTTKRDKDESAPTQEEGGE